MAVALQSGVAYLWYMIKSSFAPKIYITGDDMTDPVEYVLPDSLGINTLPTDYNENVSTLEFTDYDDKISIEDDVLSFVL